MTETNKTEPRESVKIEMKKVIQGISMVFSGTLTILEAVHPHISVDGGVVLDLITGNADGVRTWAAEQIATKEAEQTANEVTDDYARETNDKAVDARGDNGCSVEGDGAEVEPPGDAEQPTVPEPQEPAAPTVTVDDITKIIVRKIKQNRSNNEKIGQILKAYGVSKVSDLPPAKYEAFVTDMSAV